MRRSKPLAVVAVAALFGLAACGGSSDDDSNEPTTERTYEGQEGGGKDPKAEGPAPEVEGAVEGGTITVFVPSDPGDPSMDPADVYSAHGLSIQGNLINRSLTQFLIGDDGSATLVPDLATDLGTPNDDFTEWTFTIRDDATWETGDPVTAEEVAFGITRTLDAETFPGGPGTEYSTKFFLDGDTYKGPYTDKGKAYDGVTFDADANSVTIKMAKPFPDMDYWGSFMAMGPIPLGDTSNPPDYGKDPLATGPYKIESFRAGEELVLVKNDQWDPASDPARHQYADGFVFKFLQDQAQTDEIMLSGNTESQTALSTGVGSDNYTKADSTLGDHLVQLPEQCVRTITPDYTKITEIEVRKALAYAYPYESAWLASGEVPGVTRVPASGYMPPGMAGRSEYFADGEQVTFNPTKSKELLAEAGYEPGEYEITMAYSEEPLASAAQKQIVKGFEEGGFTVTGVPIPAATSLYDIWLDPDNKINKTLNLRGVNWCSDWPSGSTMIPPLLQTGSIYNTAFFSEPEIDEEMTGISSLPLEEQPAAWGALDEKIGTEYFPSIVTAYTNSLFAFGDRIGNPKGDPTTANPYYKDMYVVQ